MERAMGANPFQILSEPLLTFVWRILPECNFRPIQSMDSRSIFQFIAFTCELANVFNQFLFVTTAPSYMHRNEHGIKTLQSNSFTLFIFLPSLPISSVAKPPLDWSNSGISISSSDDFMGFSSVSKLNGTDVWIDFERFRILDVAFDDCLFVSVCAAMKKDKKVRLEKHIHLKRSDENMIEKNSFPRKMQNCNRRLLR